MTCVLNVCFAIVQEVFKKKKNLHLTDEEYMIFEIKVFFSGIVYN